MKKPVYVRCPRCELNYIEKKDKLCSVCKAELSANKDQFVNDLDLELCPICKTNYIQPDEIMCATCLKDHQTEDGEISSDWEEYLNRDEEEIIYDDEETGDMATVADLGTDTLDDDLDSGIGFDDSISDDGLDELGEELGIDLDDEDLDDEEEEEEDFEDDDDDF
ncbi:MAG: hypothetical protein IJX00_04470 [Clostridia bacterium]|nr:hypothetical protein [Clostridia bacterium]